MARILTQVRLFVPSGAVVLIGGRKSSMAKASPSHTNSPEYPPEHRNVHHDHDDCKDGKQIMTKHRENGTGGKPLCKECIRLG